MSRKEPSFKRKGNWGDKETYLLLEVYKANAYSLMHTRPNRPVYCSISDTMKQHGFDRDRDEVQTKIQNLNRNYRKEKIKLENTGSTDWKFFTYMEEIIQSLPPHNNFGPIAAADEKNHMGIIIAQVRSTAGSTNNVPLVHKINSTTNDPLPLPESSNHHNDHITPGVPLVHKLNVTINEPVAESSTSNNNNNNDGGGGGGLPQVSNEERQQPYKAPKKRFSFISDILEEVWKSQEQHHRNSKETIRLLRESLENDRKMISLLEEQNKILKSFQ